VLVGLLALPVAFYLRSNSQGGQTAAIVWNILGISDLGLAIVLGMVSQTARLREAAEGVSAGPIGYPLVMIPAFAVPLSLTLHGVSIWQLTRITRRKTSARHNDEVIA